MKVRDRNRKYKAMKKTFENWAHHDYTTKLSVSIVYALIASVALNFFINQDIFIQAESLAWHKY